MPNLLYLVFVLFICLNAASSNAALIKIAASGGKTEIPRLEALLKKQLLEAGHQISENARIVLEADIQTDSSPLEVYGVQMQKASVTISYSIYDADSGRTFSADSVTQNRNARSAAAGKQSALSKALDDIAGPIAKGLARIPDEPSVLAAASRPDKTDIQETPADDAYTDSRLKPDKGILRKHRAKTAATPYEAPALWGFIAGVSRYKSKSIASLRYADQDALSLSRFFKRQENKSYSEVRIMTLINEKVTRESMIHGISRHLGKAGPDDVVLIYISGHGIKHQQTGAYYYLPYDADMNCLISRGFRMSDFEEMVTILLANVKKVVVVIDTCHAGAMEIGVKSASRSAAYFADALESAEGLYVLASSKGGEESLEDDRYKLHDGDTGHGAFTYALIRGMNGEANYDGDMYVSISELFQYVAKFVPRLTDGRQHPYYRVKGTDLPFTFPVR